MADNDEWSSKANDAVRLGVIDPGSAKESTLFHPTFTYPIFGDEEVIFGYQGLHIDIRFAAHDLRPHLKVSHTKKFEAVGDTKAANIKDILSKWLPSDAFNHTSEEDFKTSIKEETVSQAFKPPGELITAYTKKDRKYEVWRGSFTDPNVRTIVKRSQFFVPLFIEAGTMINLKDPEWTLDRWRIYMIFETTPVDAAENLQYSFVGFCTTYRNFLHNPDLPKPNLPQTITLPLSDVHIPTASTLPCRERISQFLILPPHQHSSHGSTLYRTIYNTLLADPTVVEITVEDPNEAFDDLRDLADLAHLRTLPDFKLATTIPLPLPPLPRKSPLPTAKILPPIPLAKIRTQNKIAPRQFARVVEMHLLSLIPAAARSQNAAIAALRAKHSSQGPSEDALRYRAWQLLVKQRIYKRNRDQLMQLDRGERVERLSETLVGQEEDYARLLELFDEREKRRAETGEGEGYGEKSAVRAERSKRKTVLLDEDDDEDGAMSKDSRASKRPKV